MADIFISYARPDHTFASRLAQELVREDFTVWFDARLVGGECWDTTIERELTAARCVIVLWSASSIQSNWVRNEAGRAKDKLIPALIEAVPPRPIAFDHLQEVDLVGWAGDSDALAFRNLVDGVSRQLQVPLRVAPPVSPPLLLKRRAFWIVPTGLAAVAGATGLAFRLWQSPKRVVLMDSPLPEVVYDKEAAAKGQTNATAIAEILKDLPVSVMKESTDLEWHRESDVLALEPDLIILHGSAFYSKTNASDSAGKLRSFLDTMVDAKSGLLVYTRVAVHGFRQALDLRRLGSAGERIRFWQVPGDARASFRDPATRRDLIKIVKEMLK